MTKIFEGNLIVKTGEVYDYEKVTGNVIINNGVVAKLAALTSVGGDLYINATAKLDAPALTSVGGDLSIHANAKLDALTSVGGYLSIHANAKLDAPAHLKKNDPTAVARCRAMLLSSFAAAGFSFADGVLARIVQQRGPVYRVIICGKTEVSYLVTNGDAWSHGKTLAEARKDLIYKIGSRDTTPYKAWKLNKKVTKGEAIQAYRIITGACEGGVRSWMEQRETPDKITVKGIIELTKGAFGADVFKKFFVGAA